MGLSIVTTRSSAIPRVHTRSFATPLDTAMILSALGYRKRDSVRRGSHLGRRSRRTIDRVFRSENTRREEVLDLPNRSANATIRLFPHPIDSTTSGLSLRRSLTNAGHPYRAR